MPSFNAQRELDRRRKAAQKAAPPAPVVTKPVAKKVKRGKAA